MPSGADGWLRVLLNAGVAADNHDLHTAWRHTITGDRRD